MKRWQSDTELNHTDPSRTCITVTSTYCAQSSECTKRWSSTTGNTTCSQKPGTHTNTQWLWVSLSSTMGRSSTKQCREWSNCSISLTKRTLMASCFLRSRWLETCGSWNLTLRIVDQELKLYTHMMSFTVRFTVLQTQHRTSSRSTLNCLYFTKERSSTSE